MGRKLLAEFFGTFWLVFGGAVAPSLPPRSLNSVSASQVLLSHSASRS